MQRRRLGSGRAADRDRPRFGRWPARFFGSVVVLTDLLPPRVRYGYAHRVTGALFARPLPRLLSVSPLVPRALPRLDAVTPRCVAVLAADHLDVGGIGSVIEMLAFGLPMEGVSPVVLVPGEGPRASRLRSAGVRVIVAASGPEAAAALDSVQPDVIELHSAPTHIEDAAVASGRPLVLAMHNTEIHFSRHQWRRSAELLSASAAGVAVSAVVRDFYTRHVPVQLHDRIVIVPNGAPQRGAMTDSDREASRDRLGAVLGVDLGDDILICTLARFDSQKNVAGTVVAVLRFLAASPRSARYVFAGDPSDWAELRRAAALSDESVHGRRVHFMGNSDAASLLGAADVFLLDSFFEGWAVAASEAALAGLPIVISDVGGARELVSLDQRSICVANPSGGADEISDARVRRARRASRNQENAEELTQALLSVASAIRVGPPFAGPDTSRQADLLPAMVRGHAALLAAAAGEGVEWRAHSSGGSHSDQVG